MGKSWKQITALSSAKSFTKALLKLSKSFTKGGKVNWNFQEVKKKSPALRFGDEFLWDN